jgi:hypothetical protein
MRTLVAGLLVGALGLGGCAAVPTAPDPAECEAIFRDYDRELRFSSGLYSYYDEGRAILRPEFSRLSVRALQAGCLTSSDDLANLDALRAEALSGRPLDTSPALTERISVNLGAVNSITDEVTVQSFFRSLGYRTRSFGVDGLGRRLYVGPLATEGQVAEVLDLARRAGFVAPYATTYPRL